MSVRSNAYRAFGDEFDRKAQFCEHLSVRRHHVIRRGMRNTCLLLRGAVQSVGFPSYRMKGGEVMGTRKIGRSAISGKFVTTSTVKSHPKTTVTQTVKTGRKK
jgi:hypothetical protein